MDEHSIRKIKTVADILSFYKTFFFISAVVTVITSYLIVMLFEDDLFFIKSFLENWNKKPIIDIKLETLSCKEGYEQVTLASWPITSDICDCTNSYFYSNTIKPYTCSSMMKFMRCKNLDFANKIGINKWKGNNVCIKRANYTYTENLINSEKLIPNNNSAKECECFYFDSLNQKICQDKIQNSCPLKNSDLNSIFFKIVNNVNRKLFMKPDPNFKLQTKNKNFNHISNKHRLTSHHEKNLTTYNDVEKVFIKNFNITKNNEIIHNFAVADLMIVEHYPCLIPTIIKKTNEISYFLDFVVENINLTKYENKEEKLNNLKIKNSSDDKNRINNLNFINLNNLNRRDCYLYENSYYDKKYYVIDALSFDQFLLWDEEGFYLTKNLSLTQKINYDKSSKEKFTLNNTMLLIASPFNGWNYNLCPNNPIKSIENILRIYEQATSNFNVIITLKIFCLIYLTLYGVFEKAFQEFYFEFLNLEDETKNNKYQVYLDIFYYMLNIITLSQLVNVCFNIKALTNSHYYNIIRNDCLDKSSTKLITYLYDISDEKFIYCIFQMSVNAIEFIIFTFLFKKCYDVKLTLKLNKN